MLQRVTWSSLLLPLLALLGCTPAALPTAPPAPSVLPGGAGGSASIARPAKEGELPSPEVRKAEKALRFHLAIGDEVGIDVWKETELKTSQRILRDGTIAPPLLGTVPASGLTLDQLRADLTERYKKYLKDPKVSVHVEGIYSDRVFVLGEVKDAQAVPLHGPMRAVESIALAGGFEEEYAEKRTVRLIRRGPRGEPLVYNIDVAAVLAGRRVDPPLQRGDIVFVPARGVTDWARTVGQALEPISAGLGTLGVIAGTAATVVTVAKD